MFVYSYLIRLILKKLKKKRKIAYLSLSVKRPYNVRVPIVKSLLGAEPWLDIKPAKTTSISNRISACAEFCVQDFYAKISNIALSKRLSR